MDEQEITREAKEIIIDRRLPCEVTFVVGEKTFRGTSMHFSEKGMLVVCKNPAPLNARGKMTLKFPGLRRPIELTGEVIWTNIHGPGDSLSPKGMGIRFVNLDKEPEMLLGDLAAQYESIGGIYSCYYT